jgi:hypothetical protein
MAGLTTRICSDYNAKQVATTSSRGDWDHLKQHQSSRTIPGESTRSLAMTTWNADSTTRGTRSDSRNGLVHEKKKTPLILATLA